MSLGQLKGEPATVKADAAKLKQAAQAMRDARASIEKVTSFEGYHSGAVKALNSNASEVRKAIGKAEVRYSGAGDALEVYAAKLDAAQQKAEQARSDHAATDVGAASQAAETALHAQKDPGLTDDQRLQAQTDHKNALDALAQQRAASHAAEQAYQEAVSDRDKAAKHAIAAIKEANEESDLDDSWWDKVTKAFADLDWKKIFAALKEIADWVATIATVLAVICLVLSPFLPFLAPFAGALFLVSRIAGAVSAAIGVVQLLRGDISMKEMIIGGLFAVAGGLGKAAKVLKVGKKAFQAGRRGFQHGQGFVKSAAKSATRSGKKALKDYQSRQAPMTNNKYGDPRHPWRDGKKQYEFAKQLKAKDAAGNYVDPAGRQALHSYQRAAAAEAGKDLLNSALPHGGKDLAKAAAGAGYDYVASDGTEAQFKLGSFEATYHHSDSSGTDLRVSHTTPLLPGDMGKVELVHVGGDSTKGS